MAHNAEIHSVNLENPPKIYLFIYFIYFVIMVPTRYWPGLSTFPILSLQGLS